MQTGILRFLGIEEQEKTRVFYLVFQSIFLGIFYGAFDVGAHALFLDRFGSAMLPRAFLISGLAGILLTTAYTHFQKRIPFSSLSVFNLLIIFLFTVLIRAGFLFMPERELIFFFFVMMGPLNIIGLLGFWGTAGRLFSLRQGKRLFGLVDLGQVVGVILSSYAIPVVLTIGFHPRDTLIISSISVLAALVFQVLIGRKFNLEAVVVQIGSAAAKTRSWLTQVTKDKYIRLMALFVILSMISAFFIHYSFLAVANEQYASANDVANFLGLFNGSMMIFIILVKTLVYSRLLKTYGLQVSLALSPVLLGIFTLAAAGVGSLFGYTVASASFTMFFLAIAMSKLFSKALKDSIEAPSFKLLYQSLDPSIRHDIQARIDGTINETAAVTSGLILTILGALPFFKLIHFSMALMVILVLWFFIALSLYRRYKNSLNQTLASYRQDEPARGMSGDTEDPNQQLIGEIGKFRDGSEGRRLAFARDLHPEAFSALMRNYIREGSEERRQLALELTEQYYTFTPADEFLDDLRKSRETSAATDKWLQQLDQLVNSRFSDQQVAVMARSTRARERQLAVSLIRSGRRTGLLKTLLGSFRDLDPLVVKEAIVSSMELKEPAALPYLAELLGTDGYTPYAFYALAGFGERAIDVLEQAYYKAQASQKTKLQIVRIYADIGGKKAVHVLLDKINDNDLRLVFEVTLALKQLEYQASGQDRNRIAQVLENLIGIIGWNYAARTSVDREVTGPELPDALDEEILWNIEFIYLLLSLLYDAQTISHIRENIESGSAEGVGFAMELMDQFIAEELKPTLFPVLDDLSVDEKYRQLEEFLPIRRMDLPELLLDLVNRDYNYVNHWTKACALEAMHKLDQIGITDDMIAQLFNPDPLLRQSASLLVYQRNPDLLVQMEERLMDAGEETMVGVESLSARHSISRYQAILSLKENPGLSHLPGQLLYQLARRMEEVPKSDYLSQILRSPMVFLVSGSLEIEKADGHLNRITGNRLLLQWNSMMSQAVKVSAGHDACLLGISEMSLRSLVFEEPSLARALLIDQKEDIFDES